MRLSGRRYARQVVRKEGGCAAGSVMFFSVLQVGVMRERCKKCEEKRCGHLACFIVSMRDVRESGPAFFEVRVRRKQEPTCYETRWKGLSTMDHNNTLWSSYCVSQRLSITCKSRVTIWVDKLHFATQRHEKALIWNDLHCTPSIGLLQEVLIGDG